MTAFLSGLSSVSSFIFDLLTDIFTSYSSMPVLMAVFALWVIDRIFGIFDFIKG